MEQNTKKIILAIFAVILVIILIFPRSIFRVYPWFQQYLKIKASEHQNEETMKEVKTAETETAAENPPANQPLPETKLLDVPFICQAPLQTEANWKFHEESCEEAAVLQAYLYETNSTMTKEEADKEILKTVSYTHLTLPTILRV